MPLTTCSTPATSSSTTRSSYHHADFNSPIGNPDILSMESREDKTIESLIVSSICNNKHFSAPVEPPARSGIEHSYFRTHRPEFSQQSTRTSTQPTPRGCASPCGYCFGRRITKISRRQESFQRPAKSSEQ